MAVTSSTRLAPTTRRPRRRRWWARIVVLLALLVVAVPLVALVQVVVTAGRDDRSRSDVLVVLGAAQYQSTPSPVFANRLDHARDLLADGVAPRVVTVGGSQPGDRTTEAAAGRSWLMTAGVPGDQVIAVPTGSDTVTSLQAVAALLARNGWTSATLVTDPAHAARSLAVARALGIDANPSPTTGGAGSALTPEYVVRETAGLVAFWAHDRWQLR